GAVRALDADRVEAPEQAPAWGAGRALAVEQPDRWGGLIDLPEVLDERVRAGLAALLTGALAEGETAIRTSGVLARRLVPAAVGTAAVGTAPAPRPYEGTVLVTGGTGGRGREVARRLAETGTRHLLLASRTGPDAPGAAELVAELAAHGCAATLVSCDVTDRTAVADLLDRVPPERPLTAVVHAADLLDEAPLASWEPDRVDRTLAVKTAAWNLHELTKDLRAFVLFSSVSGALGGVGQTAYAAANTFLDALAAHRAAQGLPATSIAWGPWTGDTEHRDAPAGPNGAASPNGAGADGVAGPDGADGAAGVGGMDQGRLARRGMSEVRVQDALAVFDRAVSGRSAYVAVAGLDWGRLVPGLASAGVPAAALRPFAELVPASPAVGGSGTGDPEAFAVRLAEAGAEEAERELLALVVGQLAAVFGHEDTEAVNPDRPVVELGLNSLTAVELRNRLGSVTGLRLSPSAVFDHPTPAALAAHLGRELSLPAVADRPAAPGLLAPMFERARESGAVGEFLDLLARTARFRPSFGDPSEVSGTPVRLTSPDGDALPLICLPAVLVTSGPQQYARLAAVLPGAVWALDWPGFAPDSPLPADLDAAVGAMARQVERCAGGTPYALAGYSSGGVLAQAVARRLESDGTPPSGLVLLDSEPLAAGWAEHRTAGAMFDALAARHPAPPDDARLTAMGHYLGLLTGWEPPAPAVPTLAVRAATPLAGRTPAGAEARVVPGDHFSIIEEHAETTAREVGAWLGALPDRISSSPHISEREPE
ncbi:MAG: type I polyketide synthase, partial [Actinoallomurus sp.]